MATAGVDDVVGAVHLTGIAVASKHTAGTMAPEAAGKAPAGQIIRPHVQGDDSYSSPYCCFHCPSNDYHLDLRNQNCSYYCCYSARIDDDVDQSLGITGRSGGQDLGGTEPLPLLGS